MTQIAAEGGAYLTNSSKMERITPLIVHLQSKEKSQEQGIDEKPEGSISTNGPTGKRSLQVQSSALQSHSINVAFHDRRELTRQPNVLYNVDLSELESLRTKLTTNLEVVLYIDEYGEIVKIDGIPEDEARITELQTLRSLLMRLRFSSGEIDGKPVKFTMKIEIVLHEENPSRK